MPLTSPRAPKQNVGSALQTSLAQEDKAQTLRPMPAAATTAKFNAAAEWGKNIRAWQNWSKSGYPS